MYRYLQKNIINKNGALYNGGQMHRAQQPFGMFHKETQKKKEIVFP